MKTCRDVMTPDPVCCLPEDTVDQVAQIMKRENVGSVPVVSSHHSNRLIGIVTDRDLAMNVVAKGRDTRQTVAESVMTPNPYVCQSDDSLQAALNIMSESQVRRIPIVEEDGRIVGIIAQADIATRAEDSERTAEVVEQISQPVATSSLHTLS